MSCIKLSGYSKSNLKAPYSGTLDRGGLVVISGLIEKTEGGKGEFKRICENAIQKTDGKCVYCSKLVHKSDEVYEDYQFDHLNPLSKGFILGWGNCVIACSECNRDKSNTHPINYYKKIKSKGVTTYHKDIEEFTEFYNKNKEEYLNHYPQFKTVYEIYEQTQSNSGEYTLKQYRKVWLELVNILTDDKYINWNYSVPQGSYEYEFSEFRELYSEFIDTEYNSVGNITDKTLNSYKNILDKILVFENKFHLYKINTVKTVLDINKYDWHLSQKLGETVNNSGYSNTIYNRRKIKTMVNNFYKFIMNKIVSQKKQVAKTVMSNYEIFKILDDNRENSDYSYDLVKRYISDNKIHLFKIKNFYDYLELFSTINNELFNSRYRSKILNNLMKCLIKNIQNELTQEERSYLKNEFISDIGPVWFRKDYYKLKKYLKLRFDNHNLSKNTYGFIKSAIKTYNVDSFLTEEDNRKNVKMLLIDKNVPPKDIEYGIKILMGD